MDDQQEPSHGGAETGPRAHAIHAAIREEGDVELGRRSGAIAWSGLSAGLSMGFSFLTMALMRAALPDAPWRPLVSGFGYSLGFLITVLGRQQLFTESTLSAVLPVLTRPSAGAVGQLLRFWAVVLGTNLLGTVVFAWVICHQALFTAEVWEALSNLSDEALHDPFVPMFVKAVLAGWLIALMIWLLPGAGSARLLVIVLLTYVVAIGHFSHSVAGSVEAAFAVLSGHARPIAYLTHFLIPTVLGNTVGGVTLVAMLNHAPLLNEIKADQ